MFHGWLRAACLRYLKNNKLDNTMKIYNKLIALVAAFGLVGVSYAQDEAAGGNLTDNISIAGFIDASAGTSELGDNDTEAIGIDEVEIDFLFGFGNVTGEVHLDNGGGGNGSGDEIGVEQAHITYDVGNGFSVQIGKYGSALGFEREDPAGLYTYSRAYGGALAAKFNLGNVDDGTNVGEGIAVSYSADDYTVRISIEDSEGENLDDDSLDTEVSISYTGIDNLSVTAGIQSGNGLDDGDTVSINAAYTAGKALLAIEYTDAEEVLGAASTDAEAYLVLGHYEVSDKLGVAIRYSEIDPDSNTRGEFEQITIAPNYAITDNLLGILEFSDGEINEATDFESITLELTLTF